jgi:putative transposase
MDEGRYIWRKLNDKQRQELLNWRRKRGHPWHSPPHRSSNHFHYHVSAACYEHRHYIGSSLKRMEAFSVQCERLRRMTRRNMWSHGASCQIITTSFWPHRTSFNWNGEEKQRGRKVWYNAVERAMRSERHFWATVNYVHHNPVHHGYVKKWEEWPFSSAGEYLRAVGRHKALETWRNYPVRNYGKGWDDPEL